MNCLVFKMFIRHCININKLFNSWALCLWTHFKNTNY
nr:MAG TPA: hypothetical protein [Caudoviricetes sp.]